MVDGVYEYSYKRARI